jgi:hypothetical protein
MIIRTLIWTGNEGSQEMGGGCKTLPEYRFLEMFCLLISKEINYL